MSIWLNYPNDNNSKIRKTINPGINLKFINAMDHQQPEGMITLSSVYWIWFILVTAILLWTELIEVKIKKKTCSLKNLRIWLFVTLIRLLSISVPFWPRTVKMLETRLGISLLFKWTALVKMSIMKLALTMVENVERLLLANLQNWKLKRLLKIRVSFRYVNYK